MMFHSKKFGWLLYNALSNTFAEIDEKARTELKEIKEKPNNYDFSANPGLFIQLRQTKVLVEENEEQDLINLRRLKQNFVNYDVSPAHLTIAPTRECNFACTYCYQEFRKPIRMDDRTEDAIIRFIKRFEKPEFLSISWYGGEPLLEFDRLVSLTGKVKELGIPFYAEMTTNGYLLNQEIIGELDNLKIKSLQISIDGPEEAHNKRRILASGGGTYRKIVDNLMTLTAGWNGKCNIRVNVDKSNMDGYVQVYRNLSEKLSGKRVTIYPGIVSDSPIGNPDAGCQFNREDEAGFYIDLYRKHGIEARRVFYPDSKRFGCIATRRNSFVIGPLGEIYNCWHDMGVDDMAVGSVHNEKNWNADLLAKYMIGAGMFEDRQCMKCFFLPVCGGGCPNLRLRKKYDGEDFDTCVRFKDRLPEFLEIYYEHKMKDAAG